MNRIHIVGASGSGTTTLAKELCKVLDYEHIDTDDYYWQPTIPPYQIKRKADERIELLRTKLESTDKWILSGSLCGWGDVFIPYFDLVIYLWLPQDIRINRLIKRESERYGKDIDKGGIMHQNYVEFIDWASKYDTGDITMRSRVLHDNWISNLTCKIIKLEGDIDFENKMKTVINAVTISSL
jgi:adenylate kinase family enzyme